MPPLAPALRHRALVIAGPTAVGKSAVAVAVARRCGGEVVGADAFQIYEGLPILTAQPEAGERGEVAHHLIGEVPRGVAFDVGQYLARAEARLGAIRARGKVPVVVGGTGLYVRALLRGLAELPPADAALRAALAAEPLPVLLERLAGLDPVGAGRIDGRNPRRVIRALEVCLLTGRPFSAFHEEWSAPVPARGGVVLGRSREALGRRIEARVEAMFAAGVVEEVARAGEVGPTAAQALGWREIRAHLAGELSRAECMAAIAQATRRYAKRQETWFRKEAALEPVALGDSTEVEELAGRLAEMAEP